MEKFETLKTSQVQDVLTVALNRPESANAVNRQLLRDLIRLAEILRDRSDIAYVVLQGGEKVFSAGADLKMFVEEGRREDARLRSRSWQMLGQEALGKLESIEQIVFAAVKGSAFGAGAALALMCDFVIMADTARINLPESGIGYFLSLGCTPRLTRLIGARNTREMIMFAEDVDAATCLQWGLAFAVTPIAGVDAKIGELIAKLRRQDAAAIRVTKKLIRASAAVNFGDILIAEPELADGIIGLGDVQRHLEDFAKRMKRSREP